MQSVTPALPFLAALKAGVLDCTQGLKRDQKEARDPRRKKYHVFMYTCARDAAAARSACIFCDVYYVYGYIYIYILPISEARASI